MASKDFVFPERCTHWPSGTVEHYQEAVYLKALKYVRNFDVAIDCGAHVGIFTRRMERDFGEVYAFEPAKDNFRCLARNTTRARLMNCCLWHKPALLGMKFEDHHNSGANEVEGLGNTPAIPLDTFGLHPDLIKLDVQDSEISVLRGAVKTLENRPVLIIEVQNDQIEPYLRSIGYEHQKTFRRDQIWV